MLRQLRERWWYTLLWLPLLLASGGWTTWILISGLPLLHGGGGPEMGFFAWGYEMLFGFSVPIFIIFGLLLFLFPKGSALEIRAITAALISVALCGLLLHFFVYKPNSRLISFQVKDENGNAVRGITLRVTHYVDGGAYAGSSSVDVLTTDQSGKTELRVPSRASVEVLIRNGFIPLSADHDEGYNEETARFYPDTDDKYPSPQTDGLLYGWAIELGAGTDPIPQSFYCPCPNLKGDFVFSIYVSHNNSTALKPYLNEFLKQYGNSADPNIQAMVLRNIGSNLDGLHQLDKLLALAVDGGPMQEGALEALGRLVDQVSAIRVAARRLSLPYWDQRPDLVALHLKEADESSRNLYEWLGGQDSTQITQQGRIVFIQKRMDEITSNLIDRLHPLMLNQRGVYGIFEELRQDARPIVKYYPEVFQKGTPECQWAALGAIVRIGPDPREMAFLIKSKNPKWIEAAGQAMYMGRSKHYELPQDMDTLQQLKSQESDPEILAAYDKVIKMAQVRLNEQ